MRLILHALARIHLRRAVAAMVRSRRLQHKADVLMGVAEERMARARACADRLAPPLA